MTSASARPRYVRCLVVAVLLGGCRSSPPAAPVRVVDLLRELARADQRPPGAFTLTTYSADDVSHPAIAATVPSRLTISLPLPRHGVFHAFVSLGEAPATAQNGAAHLRVGISDDRVYEGLTETDLVPGTRGWMELRADLSAYAGWKWSVFYRPDRITWRIVLAADRLSTGSATVLWGEPEIDTDARSAREYIARRRRLR